MSKHELMSPSRIYSAEFSRLRQISAIPVLDINTCDRGFIIFMFRNHFYLYWFRLFGERRKSTWLSKFWLIFSSLINLIILHDADLWSWVQLLCKFICRFRNFPTLSLTRKTNKYLPYNFKHSGLRNWNVR